MTNIICDAKKRYDVIWFI